MKKPPLRIQPTTLWDYPSQDYGDAHQGRPGYKGATPSYIIWNLLQPHQPADLELDHPAHAVVHRFAWTDRVNGFALG
jgi:hypothetical protein